MKRILNFLFFSLIIFTLSCEKDDPTNNSNNGNNNGNTTTTKSSAKDITKFSFTALSPAVEATIDATNKTISATIQAATDLTKLVPTITVSDKATISPATGVAQDFSKEVSYTVTAEDGSTAVWKVGVTVTSPSATCLLNGLTTKFSWNNLIINALFDYDDQKRLVKITYSNNSSTPLKHIESYKYDNDGFLIERVLDITPKNQYISTKTTYAYNNGKLTEILENSGEKTTFEYETLSSNKIKKATYFYPIGPLNYTYDFKDGVLVSITDLNKNPILHTINEQGLMSKKQYDPTWFVNYIYDSNKQIITQTDNHNGISEYKYNYSSIKDKYYDIVYLTEGASGSGLHLYIKEGEETVFGPKGFKGFPHNIANIAAGFRPGNRLYLLKSYVAKYPNNTENTNYDYTTDKNGNITSFVTTYNLEAKKTTTMNYKCF